MKQEMSISERFLKSSNMYSTCKAYWWLL